MIFRWLSVLKNTHSKWYQATLVNIEVFVSKTAMY